MTTPHEALFAATDAEAGLAAARIRTALERQGYYRQSGSPDAIAEAA